MFSFVIASLAGYVAFESIEHTRYSTRPELWTFISGATLGLGIWSMHFVGMLAWKPPFPLYYALDRTLLSVLAAVVASWLAVRITIRHRAGAKRNHMLAGALLVGAGICGMHYIGMSALRFTEPEMWSRPLVLLSALIAFGASFVALDLFRRSGRGEFSARRQAIASLVLGLAICGMHYTGMFAMMLPAGATSVVGPNSFSGAELGRVGVGNALIFTVGLLVVFSRDKVRLLEATNQARFAAQEATRSAERLSAAGKIAASISHEINNPLEAVTNLLYLAEHGNVGEAEREYLRMAQDELARIAEITAHTLKFYRQQGAPTSTSLAELFESALVIFDKRLKRAGIVVNKDWDPAAPRVTCRAGEIRQVFANLVGNAIDAMPLGGRLDLSVQKYKDGVQVVAADTGQGISEADQARILEPFFTTKGASGTGLGLSISAEILQRHGGTMQFTSSTRQGASGTQFVLYLPATPPGEPASTPIAQEERATLAV
ncbi:MHYT domain-containing protein [Terriglobus aquaticus]|uniref:MHYT domain-containing protein n=1 Tax=Terriglobus aquaticus TaxID=940139 RepID=UPI0031D031AE